MNIYELSEKLSKEPFDVENFKEEYNSIYQKKCNSYLMQKLISKIFNIIPSYYNENESEEIELCINKYVELLNKRK